MNKKALRGHIILRLNMGYTPDEISLMYNVPLTTIQDVMLTAL